MTQQDQWTAVDRYLAGLLAPHDEALDAALEATAAADMPAINVSAAQGQLLHLLARAIGARRILEVGTLGGYSTIWMGRALPADGTLITLEIDPRHAEVARANLARAGISASVEVRVGPAIELLPQLAEGEAFDMVFIDADKQSTPQYLEWALRLTHPGSLIIIDNAVRGGAVIEADSDDSGVHGIRAALNALAADGRITATAIQTVGAKGYDGLAIALVTGA